MINTTFVSDYSVLRYTALHLGDHLLLLPEREVVAVIEVEELDAAPNNASKAIGTLSYDTRSWWVYDLDSDFRPTPDAAGERCLCALFEDSGKPCGLLCDATSEISRSAITTNPIAACMQSPDLLFTAIGLWNGQLVCLTNARRLTEQLIRSDRVVAHG